MLVVGIYVGQAFLHFRKSPCLRAEGANQHDLNDADPEHGEGSRGWWVERGEGEGYLSTLCA